MGGMVQQAIDRVLSVFPNLDRQKLQITSPETNKYNCIAWAAGDIERWWWPDAFGYGYWPISKRVESLLGFQLAFQSLGFQDCSDAELEGQFEKIALFCKGTDPLHAARQLKNGLWTSKLGNGFDVSHDLEGLQGKSYGNVACIMRRPIKA